jgi:hypothetical protein
LASGDPVGYYEVVRFDGTTSSIVCTAVSSTTCTDPEPLPGPVTYSVIPRIGAHWEGAPSAGVTFTYDDVAPVTSVQTRTPTANEAGWNTGEVSITLTAEDPGPVASGVSAIYYSLGGGAPTKVSGSTATFLVSKEDVTELTFHAVDNVGNVEGQDSTDAIKIDRTAPTSTGSLVGNTLTLAGQDTGGSGLAKIEYKLGSAASYLTYGSALTLVNGQTVFFRAVDVAGNIESPDHQITYTAAPSDTTAPVTTVSSSPAPNAAGWNTGDVALTLSSADAGTVTKLEWRSSAGANYVTITGPGPYQLPTLSAEGVTTIEFRATDAAGNGEVPKTYAVKIDKTAPTGAVTFPVSGQSYGANVYKDGCGLNARAVCGTASDPGGSPSGVAKVELKIQTGSVCLDSSGAFTATACSAPLVAAGTTSWAHQTGNLAKATYTLTVTVIDNAGNRRTLAPTTFTIS